MLPPLLPCCSLGYLGWQLLNQPFLFFGTGPMAYGSFIMDAAAELGRNTVSKHQIQPEYGDEQADAGRDG